MLQILLYYIVSHVSCSATFSTWVLPDVPRVSNQPEPFSKWHVKIRDRLIMYLSLQHSWSSTVVKWVLTV